MYIAVDIGGTKTLIASFDTGGTKLEEVRFPTPKDYSQFKTELSKNAEQLQQKEFAAGAIGIRGNIDREKGLSLKDDVLPWEKVPVRDDCAAVFGCPFLLENDSKLAGLSEAILLEGKFNKILYITISTGIGTAFIVDGKLDEDTQNSEFGKAVFEHNGKLQQWEDFASGRAIVEKYGKRASDIDDQKTWEDISRNFAIGILDAVLAYTPDAVVIGGGVGSHFNKYGDILQKIMQDIKPDEIELPLITGAQHPEEAVVYGCYQLAQQYAK